MDINNVLSYSLHIKTGKYAFGNCNTIFNANYFSNYSFYVYKYAAIICIISLYIKRQAGVIRDKRSYINTDVQK